MPDAEKDTGYECDQCEGTGDRYGRAVGIRGPHPCLHCGGTGYVTSPAGEGLAHA